MEIRKERWQLAFNFPYRMLIVYLFLYNLPFYFSVIPFLKLDQFYEGVLHRIVLWVGSHLLHLNYPITIFTNGSGDTTYDYVLVLFYLLIAFISGLASLLFFLRARTNRLQLWFRLYVKIPLAAAMIGYGAFKVIPSQFPMPGLSRMLQPLGETSPMGLLWAFMGFSSGYNFFTGAAEILAGILLLIPRATTIGALMTFAVMSNVFALNLFYDVPVKLYSFHLLGMSIFLAFQDISALFKLFFMSQTVRLAPDSVLFLNKKYNRILNVTQLFLIVYFLISSLQQSETMRRQIIEMTNSELRGIWEVESFSLKKTSLKNVDLPLVQYSWQKMIFEYLEWVTVVNANGTRTGFQMSIDSEKKTLIFKQQNGSKWKSEFRFIRPAPDLLILEGHLDGKAASIRLHRIDESKLLLLNRGFHWISEEPFNR